MPLSNLLKSAAGTCRHCRRKAGIIAHAHRDCQETFQAGWTEMVAIAAEATRTHQFDEKTLRLTLAEIARRSYGDGATISSKKNSKGVYRSSRRCATFRSLLG